uniref:Nucleoprotein n=1 Tax=Yichun nairovirus TaxID=2983978 RepID=A0A977TMY0_9VIRU|nr:nucleocapsid protein [Yichun nairovirus]
MPVALPRFATKEDLDRWFKATYPDVNNRTYSPSYFDGLPDLDLYVEEIDKQTTRAGKDAWVSRFLYEGLRKAPPLREQAWLMNATFFEKAMRHLALEASKDGSPVKKLLTIYPTYLATGSKCTDPEVIKTYQQACREFRNAMDLNEPDSLTGILYGSVATKVEVPATLISVFRAMLLRMKHQMEGRLGVEGKEKTDSTKFLTQVKAFFRSLGTVLPPVPLTKRNSLNIKGWTPKEGAAEQSAENGAYLLTTAIMQLRAKRDTEIDNLLANFRAHHTQIAGDETAAEDVKLHSIKMLALMECWEREEEAVTALSGDGGGFTQQGSGIDVIFSAYLWAFKLECRNQTQFAQLNGLLVGIAQSPQGKTKTLKMLQQMGSPMALRLVAMMSKSKEIHLPPFVLNAHRLYDLVTAFGAFPLDDVRCEGLDGFSSSPRYVLNLRREQGEGLALIAKSWELWSASYPSGPSDADISESEHLFHQFLLRKTSPFQNTHNLSGNALNVEVVPSPSNAFAGLESYLVRLVPSGQQGIATPSTSGVHAFGRSGKSSAGLSRPLGAP